MYFYLYKRLCVWKTLANPDIRNRIVNFLFSDQIIDEFYKLINPYVKAD